MHDPQPQSVEHRISGAAAAKSLFDRQCASLFSAALSRKTIEFQHSSSTLSTSISPLLDEIIQIATDCPAAGILVTGHTDNTGVEVSNIALSKARASAVADYLYARGILASRITVAGAGSSQPLSTQNSARARRLNRRIDIQILFEEFSEEQ